MNENDIALKELPFGDGEQPDIETVLYNLRALQGLFMATDSPRALWTVWWAEQILMRGE